MKGGGREPKLSRAARVFVVTKTSGLSPELRSRGAVFTPYVLVLVSCLGTFFHQQTAPLPWWLPPVAAITFMLAQLSHPALRFGTPFVSPRNVALGLAGLQLVFFPTLINIAGPASGQLPYLPEANLIRTALFLQILAFAGLCTGLLLADGRAAKEVAAERNVGARIKILLVLGFFGLTLRFQGSPAALADYFRGRGIALLPDGPLAAASSFLLPCLGFGLFAVALREAERVGTVRRLRPSLALLCASGAASLFSYNRAAVVVPLACFLGVYTHRVRRVGTAGLVVLTAMILISVNVVTEFRSAAQRETIRSMGVDASGFEGYRLGLNEVQLYGAAPQFLAYGLAVTPPTSPGELSTNALMTPVPLLGEPFRDQNGTNIYNQAVYGRFSGIADQALPSALEFYWDFGPIGVLLGFVLVGFIVGACHRRVITATTTSSAFVWTFYGCWAAALLVLQLETFSQIVVFWSVPALLLLRYESVTRTSSAPQET